MTENEMLCEVEAEAGVTTDVTLTHDKRLIRLCYYLVNTLHETRDRLVDVEMELLKLANPNQ